MTEPIKLHRLNPHPTNSEMWGELDVSNLVESIKETNRITPILVSHREDGSFVVLGGHRRLKAATELEWEEIDCEVHFGLTEQQEEDLMFLDNAANRIMDGDVRLKAALCLLRGKTGTQKQKIEKLAKLIGIKFDAAQKVIQTAKSVNESLNQIESKEERGIQETEVLRVAKKNGVRSAVVKKAAGIGGTNENKKSSGITAKSNDPKKDTVTVSPCLRCKELETKVAELEPFKAKAEMQTRRMKFLLASFGDSPVWEDVLLYMDQQINLSVINKHINAGKPAEDQRLRLEVWKPDLDESILHDYFFLYCNGQPVEKTEYVDVVEEEPEEDVIQDDQEEYATEEVVEF